LTVSVAGGRLMTNNPRKIELLKGLDVEIVDRIPVVMDSNEHSVGYLKAKGDRMDHIGMQGPTNGKK
jgi:3,4-dihydroxy 2-butanone 4-phosphate synthase/GTP cyclohydrolase II